MKNKLVAEELEKEISELCGVMKKYEKMVEDEIPLGVATSKIFESSSLEKVHFTML